MKFNIKRPCAHCPFRKDVEPFLTASRADQLASQLTDDHFWFACHETTGVKSGRRIPKSEHSHCAGAMAVLVNQGRPNIAMRLAHGFKMIDIRELDNNQCYDSLADFAAAYGGKFDGRERPKTERHSQTTHR